MSRPEYHHCFLSNASNIPCVLGLFVCRSFGPEVGLACGMSRTVLDLCSTVLGASTRRSPASCLRTHGARGRLFAVGSTCCLSARPAAPLHCWPLRVQSARTRSEGEHPCRHHQPCGTPQKSAPAVLWSAARVGTSSLVERWKSLYLWLSSSAPNFLWSKERGYRPRAWERPSRNVTGGGVTLGSHLRGSACRS